MYTHHSREPWSSCRLPILACLSVNPNMSCYLHLLTTLCTYTYLVLCVHIHILRFVFMCVAGDFGLFIDASLTHGSTAANSTFLNDPLTSNRDFSIETLEIYGFSGGLLDAIVKPDQRSNPHDAHFDTSTFGASSLGSMTGRYQHHTGDRTRTGYHNNALPADKTAVEGADSKNTAAIILRFHPRKKGREKPLRADAQDGWIDLMWTVTSCNRYICKCNGLRCNGCVSEWMDTLRTI